MGFAIQIGARFSSLRKPVAVGGFGNFLIYICKQLTQTKSLIYTEVLGDRSISFACSSSQLFE
jgi:hypothetical protein